MKDQVKVGKQVAFIVAKHGGSQWYSALLPLSSSGRLDCRSSFF